MGKSTRALKPQQGLEPESPSISSENQEKSPELKAIEDQQRETKIQIDEASRQNMTTNQIVFDVFAAHEGAQISSFVSSAARGMIDMARGEYSQSGIEKPSADQIRELAEELYEQWKANPSIAHEWYQKTIDHLNPSTNKENNGEFNIQSDTAEKMNQVIDRAVTQIGPELNSAPDMVPELHSVFQESIRNFYNQYQRTPSRHQLAILARLIVMIGQRNAPEEVRASLASALKKQAQSATGQNRDAIEPLYVACIPFQNDDTQRRKQMIEEARIKRKQEEVAKKEEEQEPVVVLDKPKKRVASASEMMPLSQDGSMEMMSVSLEESAPRPIAQPEEEVIIREMNPANNDALGRGTTNLKPTAFELAETGTHQIPLLQPLSTTPSYSDIPLLQPLPATETSPSSSLATRMFFIQESSQPFIAPAEPIGAGEANDMGGYNTLDTYHYPTSVIRTPIKLENLLPVEDIASSIPSVSAMRFYENTPYSRTGEYTAAKPDAQPKKSVDTPIDLPAAPAKISRAAMQSIVDSYSIVDINKGYGAGEFTLQQEVSTQADLRNFANSILFRYFNINPNSPSLQLPIWQKYILAKSRTMQPGVHYSLEKKNGQTVVKFFSPFLHDIDSKTYELGRSQRMADFQVVTNKSAHTLHSVPRTPIPEGAEMADFQLKKQRPWWRRALSFLTPGKS